MLNIGDKAPLFTAQSTQGTINLADYVGTKSIVLIFYPMDDTPGCTAQLCAVRDSKALYARMNAIAFGVNSSSLESHLAFAEKHRYDFPIIVDENSTIRKAYDVGKMLGLFAQQRIVYIIKPDGTIGYAKKGLPPTEELMQAIQQF